MALFVVYFNQLWGAAFNYKLDQFFVCVFRHFFLFSEVFTPLPQKSLIMDKNGRDEKAIQSCSKSRPQEGLTEKFPIPPEKKKKKYFTRLWV